MPTINPATGEIVDDVVPRPFHETLTELAGGDTDHELAFALRRLVDAVQDTGKGGRLTLTLEVAFDGAGRIVIKDSVTEKLPEHTRPTTSFFVDKHGDPSRRDPNQPEIPGVTQLRKDNHA